VGYPVENAVFQWEEGDRRVREAGDRRAERRRDLVLDELRRLLGSSFTVEELADLYGSGPDLPDGETFVVDAAFHRYMREALNFGGGRPRDATSRRS
jgi:hypothetical protein